MKLSKENLRFALWHASDREDDAFARAVVALAHDTLEIEGYERNEWTRFDPDDPKTFPTRKDGRILIVHHYWAGKSNIDFLTFNHSFWWGHHITHWRPLPKPPTETEEK